MFIRFFGTPYEKLIEAIRTKNIEEAQRLIAEMSITELNKVDSKGETVLTWAAYKGLSELCIQLLPKMADQTINQVANNATTALTLAARENLGEDLCSSLISRMNNQTINQVTKKGNTALTFAIQHGWQTICELLIPKMSEQAINHVNKNGNTALSLATKNGFKNICDLLTNKKDNLANEADTEKKYEEQQKQVVSAKNINIVDDNLTKWKKLVIDTKEKNQVEARNLIKHINQAELNNFDDKGNTMLISVLEKGLEIVCELLVNTSDTAINKKVLLEVASDGLEKGCELLINRMSITAINHVNNNGYTALTWATANGYERVCKSLIPKMTERTINKVTNDGETALSIATNKSLKNTCDLLHKIDGFQKLAEGINDKVATNIAINAKDKAIIKDTIEEIIHKAKELNNTTDIDKITASIQELIVDKSTKFKIITIENQLNEIIDSQNITDNISVLGDSTF